MLKESNQRLCIFFQIDFEVIEIIRSEDFSFEFTKNVGKFVIFRENHENIRSRLYKIYRIYLKIRRAKIDLKMTKA